MARHRLGQRRTYIREGTDAVIVTCHWRRDDGHRERVEQGCDHVLGSLRITD